MSIASLSKVALLFPNDQVGPALRDLQAWGNLHIISQKSAKSGAQENQTELDQSQRALNYLLESPSQRTPVKYLSISEKELVEQVLKNQNARQELLQTMLKIRVRIQNLKPWGYFNWPTQNHLGGQRLWFYCISPHQKHRIDSKLNAHIVHEDARHCWLVIVSPEEPEHDAMPFQRTHVGQRTLAELETELESAQILLEDLDDERTAMTRWSELLKQQVTSLVNANLLHNAQLDMQVKGKITLLMGWCETDNIQDLSDLSEKYSGVLVNQQLKENEEPPTLLKNPKALQAAQKLVTFFQFPGYDDWDPTPVMHVSFILFYAMILADVGYGAITLGIGAWIHLKHPKAREWSHFIFQLGAVSVIYGMLVGSYFGETPSPISLAGQLHVLDLNNFDQMMLISLIIGITHLAFGLLVKVRFKTGLERIQTLGWFWLLACALPYLFTENQTLLLAACFTPVLWLVGSTVYGNGILNRLYILFSPLMQLSKLFGDVLSYMRLFALGLASASLAITFNQLSIDIREAFPGMGVLLSILILLLGHSLNFALAIMGGVVHSMRLNCIEFFNWALDKEGYPFNPFKRF